MQSATSPEASEAPAATGALAPTTAVATAEPPADTAEAAEITDAADELVPGSPGAAQAADAADEDADADADPAAAEDEDADADADPAAAADEDADADADETAAAAEDEDADADADPAAAADEDADADEAAAAAADEDAGAAESGVVAEDEDAGTPSGSAEENEAADSADRAKREQRERQERRRELREQRERRERRLRLVPVELGAAALALGGLAAWFGVEAHSVTSSPAARNAALTDTAATSAVRSQVTSEVNALFSYNYAKPGPTTRAVQQLTGSAVDDYENLFEEVIQDGASQKLVVTTRVTRIGVASLTGSQASLLVYAETEQREGSGQPQDGTATLAINAVRQGSTWKIDGINAY